MKWLYLIILNYFRLLFVTAIISKIVYSDSLISSILQLWVKTGIFPYYNYKYVLLFLVLFVVILWEVLILYFSFTNLCLFTCYNISFIFLVGIYSFVTHILDISGDCGCFGKIIVFENTSHKIMFNTFNLLLVSYFMLLNRRRVNCFKSIRKI